MPTGALSPQYYGATSSDTNRYLGDGFFPLDFNVANRFSCEVKVSLQIAKIHILCVKSIEKKVLNFNIRFNFLSIY